MGPMVYSYSFRALPVVSDYLVGKTQGPTSALNHRKLFSTLLNHHQLPTSSDPSSYSCGPTPLFT